MTNRTIAICDGEAAYAYSLADFFNSKSSIFFAEAFTEEKSILDYIRENFVDILLISDRMNMELANQKNIGMTILISEQEAVLAGKKYPAIYKYQSAKAILKNIMNFYAEREDEPLSILNKKCKIIGVYSPVKRSMKTSFCLAMGQIMARERAVLYLNLEEYSGFSLLFQKEYKADLSDVIYYLRQDKSNILVKLEGIVESVNNLDYIPPVSSPTDIWEVKKEEWQRLFREISTNSKYDTVIVDFGDGGHGLLELLGECDQIYVPVREDYLSNAKIEQFERLLTKTGYEFLLSSMKKIKLPYHNSFGSRECYAQQLVWSELGDYVRGVIR
ncbi:P-loop NTPase family protein [Konateibacter massiliensis]|uniref:hypothetical protein n=1 Tax=Konateibacter massiliensis TaxID=2002841 RepID=UPI000C14E1BB|nr:hypothetical protein [Konateibacter massiliensis]